MRAGAPGKTIRPKKGKGHSLRRNLQRPEHPKSRGWKPESFRKSERQGAQDLPNRLLAELQRLNNNGLLVVAEATAERNGSGNEHGSGDNALQTLHGLLSFG